MGNTADPCGIYHRHSKYGFPISQDVNVRNLGGLISAVFQFSERHRVKSIFRVGVPKIYGDPLYYIHRQVIRFSGIEIQDNQYLDIRF